MALTAAQVTQYGATIKANILASPDLVGQQDTVIADLYNLAASPTYWVWRTTVSRSDLYTKQNDLAIAGAQTGFWNWTTYKNQGVAEQNAWVQMFMSDVATFAAQNIRDGIAAIFTGSAQATAQVNHCLSIGRRQALRIEKLLATGTGSTASPATLGVEGTISAQNVSDILAGF